MTNDLKSPPLLRPASTVILVRENHGALEVYLLRRNAASGFMGGLYVFPGGVVEPEDRGLDVWMPHIDISPDSIGNRLGGPGFLPDQALGYSIAAVRETLEEAGVLLADTRNKTRQEIADIGAFRLTRDLPASWFRTRMIRENWIVSLSSLGRWSHWVTPEQMKKRFDTRFFIALMPEDQDCAPDDMETGHGLWITPCQALEQNLEGGVPLSPPTIVTLTQLLDCPTLDAVKREIQNRPWGDPLAPRLVQSGHGPVIIEPWDDTADPDSDIDVSGLPDKVLPPGSWFSRIWCDRGVWKPVAA